MKSKSFHASLTAIPSSIAMLCQSIIVVIILIHGPLQSGSFKVLLLWLICETASGFIFGKISDLKKRKLILMLFQITGVIAGFVLLYFDLTILIMSLIALFFNPTPVCRAAFLDNFPKISPLRVLGATYLISYLPQAVYPVFYYFSAKQIILAVLITLCINTPLMFFLFKDKHDSKEYEIDHSKKTSLKQVLLKNVCLRFIIIGFFFAETPFNVMWDFMDLNIQTRLWFPVISIVTMVGIIFSMIISKKLPHLIMITGIYAVSIIFPVLTYFLHQFNLLNVSPTLALLISTAFACGLGGLYLPFIADAIIRRMGAKNRGFGAALIEFVDTSSSSIAAPIISQVFSSNVILMLPLFSLFYVFATFFQIKAQNSKEND